MCGYMKLEIVNFLECRKSLYDFTPLFITEQCPSEKVLHFPAPSSSLSLSPPFLPPPPPRSNLNLNWNLKYDKVTSGYDLGGGGKGGGGWEKA